MPVNTTDLMQNIYDLFTGIYAASNGAGTTLAFERLGVPISLSMFSLPLGDPAGVLSPALAVERISEIAGAVIQVQGGSVHHSNRTVEAVTELMLQQSMPATPEVMAALGAAKTSDGKRFDGTLGSLEGEFRFHPSYASPPQWYDPAAAVWTAHKVDQHDAASSKTQTGVAPPHDGPVPPPHPVVRLGPPMWHVVPNEARPALQTPGPRAPALIAMAQAKPAAVPLPMHPPIMMVVHPPAPAVVHPPVAAAVHLPAPAVVHPPAPAVVHPPVAAVVHPPAPAAVHPPVAAVVHPPVPAVAHPPVAMPVHPAIMVAHPAAFAATSAVQFRPLLMAQAAAQVNAAATTQQVSTTSLDISFEHCIVTLNRPWFPQTFTMLRDWFVPGYARGDISSGKADGDAGLMPVLPSGFVAVRNLLIEAHWSEADLATVQGSASFGPFSLLGRTFDAATGILSAPGVQIIGWFCEALPVLPPLSDPALAASVPAAGASPPVTSMAPPGVPTSPSGGPS